MPDSCPCDGSFVVLKKLQDIRDIAPLSRCLQRTGCCRPAAPTPAHLEVRREGNRTRAVILETRYFDAMEGFLCRSLSPRQVPLPAEYPPQKKLAGYFHA